MQAFIRAGSVSDGHVRPSLTLPALIGACCLLLASPVSAWHVVPEPEHTAARAGYPPCISPCATPGRTDHYAVGYVGDGCLGRKGEPRTPDDGIFGWDYIGCEATPTGIRVTVRNTGTRQGREVIQVYANGWLAGFGSVTASASDEATAKIALPEGEYEVHIGRSFADVRLREVVSITSGFPDQDFRVAA